jgi:hypothetical protein
VSEVAAGGNGKIFVGQGGAPDGAERVIANEQAVFDVEAVADIQKGLALAAFGALAVAHVECGGVVIAAGESGAYAGIHAST